MLHLSRRRASLASLAIATLVACSNPPPPPGDAATPDAPTSLDATPAPDAPSPPDDTATPFDAPSPPDAPPATDAGPVDAVVTLPDGARGCAPVRIAPPAWLEAYEREALSALTGASEIAPGVRITERASPASRDRVRTFLRDRLTALGLSVEMHNYGSGTNVIATLPATLAPGASRVVTGAHFDGVSVGPAAADNGTGTVLVLALSRWITEAFPCRTRDVVFAFFDEEELSLRGSRAYAARLAMNAASVHAVHAFDQLSWDMDGDRTIEVWLAPPPLLADWTAAATAHGGRVDPRMFRGSDHFSFTSLGLPAAGLCEEFSGGDTNPNYHRATDTIDHVNFGFLGYATTVAADVVAREVGAM